MTSTPSSLVPWWSLASEYFFCIGWIYDINLYFTSWNAKNDGDRVVTYTKENVRADPHVSLTQAGLFLAAILVGGDYDQVWFPFGILQAQWYWYDVEQFAGLWYSYCKPTCAQSPCPDIVSGFTALLKGIPWNLPHHMVREVEGGANLGSTQSPGQEAPLDCRQHHKWFPQHRHPFSLCKAHHDMDRNWPWPRHVSLVTPPTRSFMHCLAQQKAVWLGNGR